MQATNAEAGRYAMYSHAAATALAPKVIMMLQAR
jgi:hypothetical protein